MALGLARKVVTGVSSATRSLGQALDKMGASMEVCKYTERLVPSTRFVAVDGVAPVVSKSAAFVAPSANVIGDVTLGERSSIWYGATVRADGNKVTIGSNTNIGDRAVIHIAQIQGDHSTTIGNNVTVGPGAMIHAATLKDNVMVGAMAQVLDGATVGSNSIVTPGSIVSPGTTIPGGEMWAGSPAKKVKDVSEEDVAAITVSADDALELAIVHAEEQAKDYEQLQKDEEAWEDKQYRSEDYFQPMEEDIGDVLGQGKPGRIFDNTLTHPEEGLKMKK